MAHQWCNGCGIDSLVTRGVSILKWKDQAQAILSTFVAQAINGVLRTRLTTFHLQMLPPAAKVQHAADTIPSRHLHSSLNKIKHPVNVVKWTPEGRRLLTGSSSGEFTLWNGTGFNFETIMQVSMVPLSNVSMLNCMATGT